MSFSAICPNLNEQIANLAGDHFKLGTKSELGLLKGLTDQLSSGQIKVVPIDLGTGQIRTAQVMYQKRTPESEVTTTINDCITGPYQESDNFAFTVNITDQVNLEFQYDDTKIRELCENRDSWVAKDMMGKMDALYRVLDRRAAVVATANFGNYSDGTNSGTSPISLGLIQPLAAGGMNGANYQGESIMLNALSDARIVGKPMAFGTGALREYSDMRAISNNNALGMDLSTDQNFIFLSDPIVSDVIGNVDEFLVMEAGAMQFIPVPQFVGQYQQIAEFRGNSTIVDPRFGVTFDLNYFQPEGCPNQWKMRLSLNYALPVMYNDAYQPSDYLFGVNGIFKFDAA